MAPSEDNTSSPNASRFQELIARARQGKAGAIAELIDNYRNYLLLIANHNVEGPMKAKLGASDVVQESILHAQLNFDQFAGEKEEEFKAWLRTILANDIRKEHRKFNTLKRRSDREVNIQEQSAIGRALFDAKTTPGTNALQQEQLKALAEALQALEPNQREVIQLRNFEALDFEQIGRRMDRSGEAARKLWARAIDALSREMRRHSPDMLSAEFMRGPEHE